MLKKQICICYNYACYNFHINMGNVKFEEEIPQSSSGIYGQNNTPKMTRLLIKLGIVKTEKQAFWVMIIFVVLVFSLTFYIAKTQIIDTKVPDYVVDAYGNKYSVEEYTALLKQGKDPLSPNFKP